MRWSGSSSSAISDAAELERYLRRERTSGKCEFWIGGQIEGYPQLVVCLNGKLAYLHYFAEVGHAGFHSLGELPGLDPNGTTHFLLADDPEHEILNYSIVTFDTALQAAKEFFVSGKQPTCLNWFEL
jgi:Immunity protein Imm1